VAKENLNLNLLACKRDKEGEEPAFWWMIIDTTRRPIEGVISVLTECFGFEDVLVRGSVGLLRRT
jgi:hypothetical protein